MNNEQFNNQNGISSAQPNMMAQPVPNMNQGVQPNMMAQPMPNMNQGVQPNMMAQPVPGVNTVQPNVVEQKKQASSIQEGLSNLDKEKTFKFIGMIAGLLIIIGVFLPYISYKTSYASDSVSLWENESAVILRFAFIILGLIPIATFFFQKAKQLSYLTAGAVLSFDILQFGSWLKLDTLKEYTHLSFGFYAFLLAGLALVVINVIENIDEIKSIFVSEKKNNVVAPVMPVPNVAVPNANMATNQNVANVMCPYCGKANGSLEQFCSGCGSKLK